MENIEHSLNLEDMEMLAKTYVKHQVDSLSFIDSASGISWPSPPQAVPPEKIVPTKEAVKTYSMVTVLDCSAGMGAVGEGLAPLPPADNS